MTGQSFDTRSRTPAESAGAEKLHCDYWNDYLGLRHAFNRTGIEGVIEAIRHEPLRTFAQSYPHIPIDDTISVAVNELDQIIGALNEQAFGGSLTEAFLREKCDRVAALTIGPGSKW